MLKTSCQNSWLENFIATKKEELLALAEQHKSQLTLVRAFRTKYGLTAQEADKLRQKVVRLKYNAVEAEA